MGDPQGSFGLVERRQQVVVSTVRIESWKIGLDESGDALAVTVDGIGDDRQFGGNGGEIDGRHLRTLGEPRPRDSALFTGMERERSDV